MSTRTSDHANLVRAIESQQCPYLARRCVKQRKSDPHQTIGACTVAYQGSSLIICPHRFITANQIFQDCVNLIAASPRPVSDYYIVPEVKMPGGNVDYFLVALNGTAIYDYVGIEIQSLDTTGSGGIWEAREDALSGHLTQSYKYGINWRMSAKTILMQMLHKVLSFEGLGKKLVLVVQSEFFEYMSREFSTAHLRAASSSDTMHFHIYSMVSGEGRLGLQLVDRRSTTGVGIAQMLALGRTSDITDDEVKHRLQAKLPAGRSLASASPLDVPAFAEDDSVPDSGD